MIENSLEMLGIVSESVMDGNTALQVVRARAERVLEEQS
jgi:hypothetical protein